MAFGQATYSPGLSVLFCYAEQISEPQEAQEGHSAMDWKQNRFDLQYSHLDPTLWDLQGSMAGIE